MTENDTSTPLGPLFRAQWTLIDRTIETQRTLHRQGLELTRQSTRTLFGVLPASDDAEAVLDDVEASTEAAVDAAEEATEETVESTLDTAEEATEPAADAVEATGAELDGTPVGELSGIGATYSGRLEAAGIGTVEELAAASVAEVAEAAQVGTDRAAEWVDRAQTQA